MSFKDNILNNQSPWGAPPGGDGGRGSPGGNGSGSRQDPPSLDAAFTGSYQMSKELF